MIQQFFNRFRALQASPNCNKCSAKLVADITSSFAEQLLTYTEITFLIWSSCDMATLTMDLITEGVTFRPNPSLVRQYLFSQKNKCLKGPKWFHNAHL